MRNDQAYFMLVFGRFEEHVNAECKTLIAAKQAAPNWLDRRCWDTLDIDKLEFMRKIALLTIKGHREYNRVYDIFNQYRNNIAHGNVATMPQIALRTLAIELLALSGKLRAK